MATSAAKIAANRENSKKSTGPRSISGKNQSRKNSLKHALTAKVLRTEEEVLAIGEAVELPPGPLGTSPFDRAWLLSEAKLLSHRIERASLMELRLRERVTLRASICWEGDRKSDIETIGNAIHRRPAEVTTKLQETTQGCSWLMERWAMLARAADRDGVWDESARSLAFDLLGTPLELRKGLPGEVINLDGHVQLTGQELGDVARGEVARLLAIRNSLVPTDDFDRSTAQAGLAEDLGAAGRRLRRYETALRRRLDWCLELLEKTYITSPTAAELPEAGEIPPLPDEPEIADADDPETFPIPAPMNRRQRRARLVKLRKLAAAAETKLERRVE